MSDKKNDEKRTAVIRFADRYFILVSFVYSLKCRIPTNTPNFVYFCCGCGFCCCRMIHDQLCFICILFFLEKKNIPLHTQTERKYVWSALNQWRFSAPLSLSMSLSHFLPYRFVFFFPKINGTNYLAVINLKNTHTCTSKSGI